MYGLGLRTTLSALLRLCTRRRPTMRPAHGLAAHRRLAALHTAALALGLTARRYSAETGGERFVHRSELPFIDIGECYHKLCRSVAICFMPNSKHSGQQERLFL